MVVVFTLLKYLNYCICSEEAEGYTSLYDDNQYEEIQPEVKFEGLRSVKELLLKVYKLIFQTPGEGEWEAGRDTKYKMI